VVLAALHPELEVLRLDEAGVGEHDGREIAGAGRAEDRTREAPLHQQRQAARVVDVGVAEDDEVNLGGVERELLVLNNLVEQYLVFAEGQAMQRIPMRMTDWIERLNEFLQINRKDILKDAGKVSHELAVEIAEKNFAEYKKNEAKSIDDDFDLAALHALETAKKRTAEKTATKRKK
jgi:hypothetical protein